jgi:hypothetical protein
MDTMGQAAALTGGYGSSFGQAVGQQAYQGYLQQLNDRIPELYQLALSQYQMEGDSLYNQAALMAQMEDQDYGRYRDQVADYYTELEHLYGQYNAEREYDYGTWADGRDFAYGEYSDNRAYDYQTERDKIADQQWKAQFDAQQKQWQAEQNYRYAQLAESKRQYNDAQAAANNTLSAAQISRLQASLGVKQSGVWDSATESAAKAKYGTTNANKIYDAWHNQAVQSSYGITDFDSAIKNMKANGVSWDIYAYLLNEADYKKNGYDKEYANYKDYVVDYLKYAYENTY